MVEEQIARRGIRDPRVLDAMRSVPRHEFVSDDLRGLAYADQPLPIGEEQTISQPYMVAAMTEALALEGPPKHERVLEIGAGSGYQTAVLALLAVEVWSVELHAALADAARARLARLGIRNVHLVTGDGTLGWPDVAPYDGILVSAAAPRVPPPLVEQLAEGGRLVIPVGAEDHQELLQLTKREGRVHERRIVSCRFVPLIGQYGWKN